jgi:hypothetical protein
LNGVGYVHIHKRAAKHCHGKKNGGDKSSGLTRNLSALSFETFLYTVNYFFNYLPSLALRLYFYATLRN